VSDPIAIRAEARSGAPRAAVFALLADASTWAEWTPFDSVALVEPGDASGVGAVKQTRVRGLSGRERVVSLVPDERLVYRYEGGALAPLMRDYEAVVELAEADGGTVIRWRSSFRAAFPGAGWLPRRLLGSFLQQCADGLARRADQAVPAQDEPAA
jgi:uncharacterized protein YndB with AHSA1/START domain